MKNIFLYIVILILILIIIYQNSNEEETLAKTTPNLSYQKVEKCEENPEIVKEVIDNHINKNPLTDQEAVSKIKKSLELARVNKDGVSIEWSIDTKEITNTVKLIASISKNNSRESKIFKFKIDTVSKEKKVNEIAQKLTFDFIKVDNKSLDEISSHLNFPEIAVDGSKIIWNSDNQDVISNKGIVITPSFNEYPVEVTITATIINTNGEVVEKNFDLTVMPDESEIREIEN